MKRILLFTAMFLLMVASPALGADKVIFIGGGGGGGSDLTDIDSDLLPDTDDTYDIGSSSKEWKNIYIDGTAYIDTISILGGSAGQFLQTNGAGVNSWDSVTGITIDQILAPTVATLTSAEVTATIVNNYGQAAADVYVALPPAAEGLAFNVVVGTAQAGNSWAIHAAGADVIYLDGAAGAAGGYVTTTPVVGTCIKVIAFKTGATVYSWAVYTRLGTWSALATFNLIYASDDNIVLEDGDNLVIS